MELFDLVGLFLPMVFNYSRPKAWVAVNGRRWWGRLALTRIKMLLLWSRRTLPFSGSQSNFAQGGHCRSGGFLCVLRPRLSPFLGSAIRGGYRYHPQDLQWGGQQVLPLRRCVGIAGKVKSKSPVLVHTRYTHFQISLFPFRLWRKGRDSNPRNDCSLNAFREHPVRPLRHPSFGRTSWANPIIIQAN